MKPLSIWIISSAWLLAGCATTAPRSVPRTDTTHKSEPQSVTSAPGRHVQPAITDSLAPGRSYDIATQAEMRDGPGENYEKKINQKASDMLGNLQYLSVDSSVTVKVIQLKDAWAEVQVTQPEHLAASHRGWIPRTCISGGTSSAKLDGWIRHTCRVFQGKSVVSPVVGLLIARSAANVADDGTGWLRLIFGAVRTENGERFLDSPNFDSGLYIEAANFTTVVPGKWKE